MSSRERRISPRKVCVVPLRFRIISNRSSQLLHSAADTEAARVSPYYGTFEGQSVNLSERGIYFRSREKMSVGQPLEMYLTIPRELTGRASERVRCSARVVHAEQSVDQQGMLGVGAAVDRFEPVSVARDWGN